MNESAHHSSSGAHTRPRSPRRRATESERIAKRRAANTATARQLYQEHGAAHDCRLWLRDGRCEVCDRVFMAFRVGDIVRVAHAIGENLPHTCALVIELYDRAGYGGDRTGALLLFPDGFIDGFSPDDCQTCGVVFDHHVAALADYDFRSVSYTAADLRAGRFAAAWR